ncbi:AsmA family protein [Pseudomonas sp. NPDC007930]|uniref:AsmA family protein n=1 Tax=Pseudomonas sp. NPDC007930 TaxID=3364417 RepID=UPI0036EB05A2
MKAFGKIMGIFVLGLLLILVALGFALTHLFDPNDYKDEIRQLARDKAHVELTLNGDIGWSLFPWLGLELHDASVATLQQPTTPFADLQLLGLSVRVLPLLRKEVQMSDIRVEGLNLKLARDANGHGNWQDIGKPLASADAPAGGQPAGSDPAAEKPASNERPVKLDIDSLTVNNATVSYSDEQSGRNFNAESIQLSTGAVHEGADIPLKLTAFIGTNLPQMRARTELAGQLRFDRALKRYQFEDMRLSGEVSGEPLQGKTVTFSTQGQLLADLAANVADWSNLKLAANQMRALGELHLRNLDSDPQLSGALSIAQFDLRAFLDGLAQPLPATADPAALTSVELVARLQGSKNSLALEDLTAKVDGATFNGRLAVDDFAKQAVRAQLKADRFNADRYLPPASKNAEGQAAARKAEVQGTEEQAVAGAGTTPLPDAPSKGAWSDDRLLPVERLRSLDLNADLAFGQLTLKKLAIDNAVLKAQSQGGLATLQTLGGEIANGRFETHGTLDARGDTPKLALQTQLQRVPVELVLKAQNPEPPVRGALTLNSDFSASGNSQKALVDSLNGDGRFTLENGVLVNANLDQQLCQGIATLNQKSLSSEPRGKDTAFRQLAGSLSIRNGVANNPDLKAAINGLSVNGQGDIDLRTLGMDYTVGVVVEGDKSDLPDPACQVNDRFANIEVPIRCRGPLELGAKACRIDRQGLASVGAQLLRNRVEDKLDEKLGDKVSPQVKDALKGLFNR